MAHFVSDDGAEWIAKNLGPALTERGLQKM
jgi:hypothetical protein